MIPFAQALLAEGVHQATAVRILLQLLSPDSRRHFPPAIFEMLHPPQRIVKGSSGKSVTDLEGEEVRKTELPCIWHARGWVRSTAENCVVIMGAASSP